MRWPHIALLFVAAVMALGPLGVQLWVGEQQLAAQKVQIAAQEAVVARHKADLEAWQALAKAQPGQPLLPRPVLQPMPTVYQPPVFFPWFLWLFPALMAPAWFAVAAEQQRVQKLREHE